MTKLTADEQFRTVKFIIRTRTEHPRWSMTKITEALHKQYPDMQHVTWHDVRYYFDSKIAPYLNSDKDNYATLDPYELLPHSRRVRSQEQDTTLNSLALVERTQRLIMRHQEIQTALVEHAQAVDRLKAEDRQIQDELAHLRDAFDESLTALRTALEALPSPAS